VTASLSKLSGVTKPTSESIMELEEPTNYTKLGSSGTAPEDLVTQVRQPDDHGHQGRDVAVQTCAFQTDGTKKVQRRCCWRLFSNSCLKRKPKNTSTKGVPSPAVCSSHVTHSQPVPANHHSESSDSCSASADTPKTYLLPPLPSELKNRKTLVLDLDETLVHSSFKPIPNADFIISIELDNVIHRVYVRKRPGVDTFLKAMGARFEMVIFTASLSKYADPVLDQLDIHQTIHTRLFREHCVQHYGNYVKDLSHLGRKLEHTVIIDNSPFSYMFQPDNAIPISSWFNDRNDRQLLDLIPVLEQLADGPDVYQVLQSNQFPVLS